MKISGERDPWDTPCEGSCPIFGDDCRTCGRTAEEIRLWNSLTREQKQKVNERINKERGEAE